MTTDCDTRRARIEVEILPPYSERFAAAWSGRDDEEPEWAKTISLGGSGEALGLLDITSSRLWSRGSAREKPPRDGTTLPAFPGSPKP